MEIGRENSTKVWIEYKKSTLNAKRVISSAKKEAEGMCNLAVTAENEDNLIKKLNEWKNNMGNRDMRVNMNKTKVLINGERQKLRQRLQDGHVVSVPVVRSGYTRSVVV